jgi:hypothetical protein
MRGELPPMILAKFKNVGFSSVSASVLKSSENGLKLGSKAVSFSKSQNLLRLTFLKNTVHMFSI